MSDLFSSYHEKHHKTRVVYALAVKRAKGVEWIEPIDAKDIGQAQAAGLSYLETHPDVRSVLIEQRVWVGESYRGSNTMTLDRRDLALHHEAKKRGGRDRYPASESVRTVSGGGGPGTGKRR